MGKALIISVIVLLVAGWLAAVAHMREQCYYDQKTRCPTECVLGVPAISLQVSATGTTHCLYPLVACSGIGKGLDDTRVRLTSCALEGETVGLYFRYTHAEGCPATAKQAFNGHWYSDKPDNETPISYHGQFAFTDDPYYEPFPGNDSCVWEVTIVLVMTAVLLPLGIVFGTAWLFS